MAQSLTKIYVHLTFGTKFREPLLCPEIRPELNMYLTGALKNMNCPVLRINAVWDHVHILFRMSKIMPISDIAEEIKKQSSKWIKSLPQVPDDFFWQRGYGAFSVCYYSLNTTIRYIEIQEEHHKDKSYKHEIKYLMKKHNITEFNEKFYWD